MTQRPQQDPKQQTGQSPKQNEQQQPEQPSPAAVRRKQLVAGAKAELKRYW